jgi:ADP-ribosyl-[dinitrogen reductase] hydrolase
MTIPDASPDLRDRYRGALLGLAVGDAVGTTLEFKPPGSFEAIDDMIGGGPFGLEPGQWTDDTSMALCLAESLIERGFDPEDQLRRYVRWWREGYLSSTGRCFDIGTTTRTALAEFERTGRPDAGPTDPYSAGNGSIMRLAPVPMRYASDKREALRLAGDSSLTTHGAPAAIDACRYFALLIVAALHGQTRDEFLNAHTPGPGGWYRKPYVREVELVAAGSFLTKEPPEIRGTGYVVESLEAALWAFDRTDTFRDAVLAAANLGDDADTTAAICGQLAGAYYGASAIPDEWLEKLAMRERIQELADALLDLSGIAADPEPSATTEPSPPAQ